MSEIFICYKLRMNTNIWSTSSNLTLTNQPVSCELYKLSCTIWLSSLSDPSFYDYLKLTLRNILLSPKLHLLVIIFSFTWLIKYPFLQSKDSIMMTEGLIIWTEMI